MAKTRQAFSFQHARKALRQRQEGKRREKTSGEIEREAPLAWEAWLRTILPSYFDTFAERHQAFWQWVWAIRPGEPVDPILAIWPRGGGKSTGAEGAVVALGAPRLNGQAARRYVVYVRETQAQADKSVGNIAEMLESDAVGVYYPGLATRKVSKFGQLKGWRRDRLYTASGLVVDALGLDTAARGLKVGRFRPDLIIFDDIDGRHDTARTMKKKTETLTDTILPMGTPHCAVLVIQNKMIPHGVVSRLADGRADFLVRRRVSGPHKAIDGLRLKTTYDEALGRNRTLIVGGKATWAGQDLEACQAYIDRFGVKSFKRECQHEVDDVEGALWTSDRINENRVATPPTRFKRVAVGVDPSGGAAEVGIVAAGLGYDGHVYVMRDVSGRGKPRQWGRRVSLVYHLLGADRVVAEKNFGGDMVEATLKAVDRSLAVKMVSASRGKDVRAEPVSALYDDGLVHHVGVFDELEAEMTTWRPGDSESPNRMDALVWVITELMLGTVSGEVEAAVI